MLSQLHADLTPCRLPRRLRPALWGLLASMSLGAACSEDDPATGGVCGEGAVVGTNEPHCEQEDGAPIVQTIGACVTGAVEEGEGAEAEAEGEEHEHEEGEEHEHEHEAFFGRESVDDDCKYRVRFENTCVAVNEPVTLTLTLTRLFDGMPGAGINPAYPEVYMADDLTHISPSNDITATETSAGMYAIGPVIFDRAGRWVVRFHYFDMCSEATADSPHGHAAFYIDVP